MAKPDIAYEDLEEIADAARQIHEMPAGPEKEKYKAVFKSAHARLLEEQDMPAEAIAPDAHLLGIVDWGSGALRTAFGESALMVDALLRGDKTYDSKAGTSRLMDAIIPVGNPAAASSMYLDELKVPEGGQLTDTRLGQMLPIERGGTFDITPRGALGFLLDAGVTPRSVTGGVNKIRNFGKEAAVQAPKTAAQQAAELALQQKEARLAPPRSALPGFKSTTEAGKTSLRFDAGTAIPGAADLLRRGVADPLKELGEWLYKSRFKNADEAALDAGKKAPSQIMMEHGMPGVTSGGIRQGMRGIIDRTEDSINALDTPEEMLFVPTRQQSQFLHPVAQANAARASKLPGSSIPNAAAIDDVLQDFEHAARQDPGIMEKMREAQAQAGRVPIRGGELLYEPGASQMTLPGVPKITSNSGFETQAVQQNVPRLKKVIDQPGKPGGMRWKELPDGSKVMEPYPPTPPTYKMVPDIDTYMQNQPVYVERAPTVEPGRPVTMTEGRLATHGPAPKTALETYDRPMSWADARQMRRNYQKKSADAGLYSQRDRLQPGPQAQVDATAKLHNAVANRAGELELEMLDEARPGLGGGVWNKHRDISGLLEGGQYLDREYTGGGVTRATTGTKRAFAPTDGRLWDYLDAAKGVAQAGGGKVLLNPWTRNVVAPTARSMWLNNYWQRELEESDTNPYGLIKKYGAKR